MLLPSRQENPVGLQTAILSISFTILAGLFVIARVLNRLYILKHFAVDDYLILVSIVSLLSVPFVSSNDIDESVTGTINLVHHPQLSR